MTRYKLIIEYDGQDYVGWQRQVNGPSIQAAIEAALEPLAGGPVTLHGGGRTDAGVHALGQVAHVDLSRERAADELRDSINFHLKPAPIAILEAVRAEADFHARFSAVRRRYRYRIINRRPRLTLDQGRAWQVGTGLDAAAMHEAAQLLLGRHDFTTFRSAQCQAKSPVKTLDLLEVSREAEEITITAMARSFLHNQVRSLVGSLKLVGEGKWQPQDLADALAAKDRRACGPVAPARGLYLLGIDYSKLG